MSKIARVKFIRDKEPNIKALTAKNKVLDGALYVATDTGTLWMGISSSSLIQIKDNINTNTTYNLTKSGNTITLRGSDGSTFNVTDSNTVYGNATASAAGLMSAADKAKLDGVSAGSNHVTVDAELSTTSTNPVQNKVIKSALDGKSNTGHTHDDRYYTETEINTKLNGKSNTGHKHVKADITDFPTSMPASDVPAWAKAASKPSYTIGEVSGNLAASRISGTISAANLPSYVDDVLEYASLSKFPTAGESGKIYTALDTNKIYRWSGSAYVVISETVALGTTHSSAGYGDESHAAYNHSTSIGNPHKTTKADLGLGSVENKSSATIRGELTSANVTTALGYTPPKTDTNTWRPVQNNLTSTATDQSLSAAQGKALNEKFGSYVPTSRTVNGKALRANITLSAGDVGAAPSSHSHSYLPLAGGTMTGKINRGAGGRWIDARNNVVVFGTTARLDAYNPVVGQKTAKGSWSIGNLTGDERLVFSYDTDANFKADNNDKNATYLPVGGRSQEIITSATIGSQSVSHANTAGSVAWSNVSGRPTIPSVGNGTVTITQNGTKKGSFTLNQSGNATIALTDTNTNTWRPVQNNLTSTATDQSLSAAQGKALNEKFGSYVPTSRTVNGKALRANITLSAGDVGAAPSSHSHSYLPLAGGTMTGKINRGAGGRWIDARNNVVVFGTTARLDAYNPVVGQKTAKGSWSIGNLTGDERLVFSYDTDANFKADNNDKNATYLPVGGRSQEIITSATIGSQSVSHANTAGSVAWSNVSGRPTIPSVGNGTVTITQNGTKKGSFTLNQSGNATIALTDTNTNTWRPEEVIVSSSQPSASTCKLWIKV